MVSLELFSGSKVFSNYMASIGFDAISVDSNPKLNPSICCDILDISYDLLPGSVNVLWASPDCATFSRMARSVHWLKQNLKYRKYSYKPLTEKASNALALVHKVFDIIDLYNPGLWIIENPVGRFRHLDIVRQSVPYRYSVNYKDWGFDYSKETDIFTNFMFPFTSSVPLRPGKSVASLYPSYSRSVVPVALIEFMVQYYLKSTGIKQKF